MEPIEQLRQDMTKLLVLLTHAACGAVDARLLLQSLMVNLEAMTDAGQSTPGIETSGHAMLLAASSATLKQNPGDPDMLALYQELRARQTH